MSESALFYKNFPKLTWDFSADYIKEHSNKLIEDAKSVIDSVLELKGDQICFKTVIETLALHEAEFESEKNIIGLILSVSPDQAVRDAANEANRVISEFCIATEMRKDLYDLFSAVRAKEKSLPYESDRYLNKCLLYKKRNGLHLSKDKRDSLELILKEMMNLCINYNRNISEENVKIEFDHSDLEGVSDDFIKNLTKENNKYIVTLKYPHVIPILKYCKVVKTRQTIEKAYNSRCIGTNVDILEQLIKLRHQRAQILGYKTHVDFNTEILMSKSAKNVFDFLSSLSSKLVESSTKEMERLLDFKRQECCEIGTLFDGKINPYDLSYYQRIVEERDFSVDQNIIKQYFPFENVTQKLLQLYQSLLCLRFDQVENTKSWHPEVTLYSVRDRETDALLGYFYLDLFPREGKYTHAACFTISSACITENGEQLACAAMVANFTKPTSEIPSMLTHDEVETYFHEFGHVMHNITSKTHYAMFQGTSVERDFVEAPSQMLENWVWEEEALRDISSHYITKETLSEDLITKLCRSRKANISLFYMRQISLAMFDYKIHTSAEANTFDVYKECMREYLSITPTSGTNFSASFGHMCGDYDAQYYGYLWSLVFACDMFLSRFKKEGIFNHETGMSYRKNILEPGSTKDGSELLRQFLGRDPIMEPFLKIAGIIS